MLACGILGCSSENRDGGRDLVAHRVVRIETVPAANALLTPPRVVQHEGGVVEIAGQVKRAPQYEGPVDGHVHIDVVDPASGEIVEDMSVGWTPDVIPTTGERAASYRLDYLWSPPPPPGTVLRFAVVPDDYESDNGSGEATYGSAKGGTGAGKPVGTRTGTAGGTAGGPESAPPGKSDAALSIHHARGMGPRGPHTPGGSRMR